jgi:hypothetical protein
LIDTSNDDVPPTFRVNATARGALPEDGLAEQVAVRSGSVTLSSHAPKPSASAARSARPARDRRVIVAFSLRIRVYTEHPSG